MPDKKKMTPEKARQIEELLRKELQKDKEDKKK